MGPALRRQMERDTPDRHIEILFELCLDGGISIPMAESKTAVDLSPSREKVVEFFFFVNLDGILVAERDALANKFSWISSSNAAQRPFPLKMGKFSVRFVPAINIELARFDFPKADFKPERDPLLDPSPRFLHRARSRASTTIIQGLPL